MRAVSYIRQSKRREDDSQASPMAQRERCSSLIASKGWDDAGHFEDVGKSGWDPGVHRPGFEEMMAAVRGGHVDAVIVFSLSRLTRRGALEAMKIIDELERYGVRLVSVEEPYLDTSTPVGVGILAIIAGLAQQESDLKSEYITSTKDTLRRAGSHVSGHAPFGFRTERKARGKLTVTRLIPDPIEAPIVRDMVTWVGDGLTASAVSKRLNESGVLTKAAGLGESGAKRIEARRERVGSSEAATRTGWTSSTVLRILRDPRLAGYAMEWQGRQKKVIDADGNVIPGKAGKRVILRDDEGRPVEAHEAIIPADEWWKLQDVLDGRTKTVVRSGRRVPTLLAGHGLLFCDVCGSVMVSDRRSGKLYYKCNRASGVVAGHGGLVISMADADDAVARRVWARLTAMDPDGEDDREWLAEAARRFAHQRDTSQRETERAATRAELEHVREALRTLYQDRQQGLYAGEVGSAMFREFVERLTAHEQRVTERLAELDQAANVAIKIPAEWTAVDGDPIGEGTPWYGWSLEDRREFLAFFIDSVRIAKAAGRGRYANTRDRILIRWAEKPGNG
ncbi:recombinase family protein [Streptomyces niger]|uniref:recombinase family protein n=1 Tax=Streptomyces niger TaxID=66373 RepID=UPI0018FE3137|nr:recombinase family protein [Streptomyces niger]